MKKSVFLNRHFPDNLALMDLLVNQKIPVLIEPLISIQLLSFSHHHCSAYDAIIATSRYGLDGLIQGIPQIEKQTPVIAVGASTSQKAQDMGFQVIISGTGTASDIPLIVQQKLPGAQQLIYARGKDIAFPLEDHLTKIGYGITSIMTYEAQPSEVLTEPLISKIQKRTPSCSIFYSARTANLFREHIQNHHLEQYTQDMPMIALSQQIYDQVSKLTSNPVLLENFSSQQIATFIKQSFYADCL